MRNVREHLAGKRILIVEDEYLVAFDLARALTEQGAEVVGPVGDLKAGLALVKNQRLDAAVLDVNLTIANSYPIADVLIENGVPYIFLTGYDGWALPEKYQATPRVAKPFAMSVLLSAVERLLLERVAA